MNVKTQTQFWIWFASQDRQLEIHSTLRSADFERIVGRPTKTADFGTSLWQIPYSNNICSLQDKIQNRGMYLFPISQRSDAMDQRSGDGSISGWSQNFAFYQRNSWSRLWVTRRESCSSFSTEQNHPEHPLQEKVSLEEMKAHKEDRFFREKQIAFLMAREMGSPRQVKNRRRRSRKSPEPSCAQTLLRFGVAHAGEEGWINILPWYRSVSVEIQVKWAAAHVGQDRRLPSVVTHSRLQRATSVRLRVGIVFEDGSRVAVDWVTGRLYSSCFSARSRLDAQSGQRKGRKGAAPPIRALLFVIVVTEKVMRMGPLQERRWLLVSSGKVIALGVRLESGSG